MIKTLQAKQQEGTKGSTKNYVCCKQGYMKISTNTFNLW
jgi:hypothetical protein